MSNVDKMLKILYNYYVSKIKMDYRNNEFAILVKWSFVEFCQQDNQEKNNQSQITLD